MKVRIGRTEWPSITAWAQDMVLCVLLNRHDWDDWPACRRCGLSGRASALGVSPKYGKKKP